LRQVGNGRDLQRTQRLGLYGDDTYGDALQILAASLRGDDDFLKASGLWFG